MSEGLSLDECVKKEKIDGVIYNMSPGGFNHAIINSNISDIIKAKLKRSLCLVFSENLNLYFDGGDYLAPDVMIICDRKHITPNGYNGVPKFIVETLSPGTAKRDVTVKKEMYAKKGVEEYWIVDPRSKSIEIYYLQDSQYVLQDKILFEEDEEDKYYNANMVIKLKAFPNVELRLEDIFEGTLKAQTRFEE